jgi:hypothetical protein
MSLLHRESFPAQQAGWILSYSLDQFSGRGSPATGFPFSSTTRPCTSQSSAATLATNANNVATKIANGMTFTFVRMVTLFLFIQLRRHCTIDSTKLAKIGIGNDDEA